MRTELRGGPILALGALVVVLSAAGCGGSDSSSDSASASASGGRFGTLYEKTGSGPMVKPTIPDTPSVKTEMGEQQGNTRTFRVTAGALKQKIANFPLKTATVWGYNGSSPGPTLIAYEGERIKIVLKNKLPEPTTLHPHGLHQSNDQDGVAAISQPNPIKPGKSHTYDIKPGHVGTFAYHSHFDSAVQEMRGLDGFIIVLPRKEHESVKADVDVAMTLQIWGWPSEGALVKPFGVGPAGKFPIDTINGKTGDASGGPITIKKGDLVRIRFYNASQETHAMHLHGHDEIVVSKNGHAVPKTRETTQTITPGDFYEIQFRADNPGNWIFHCHFPHHTANMNSSGFNGAPVGMTRIFHYAGYRSLPEQYFSSAHFKSKTVKLKTVKKSALTPKKKAKKK